MTTANSSPPIGSTEWLEDLQHRSAQLQENIDNSVVTLSSRDEAVTVTVGPNGSLHDLSLGHRAAAISHTQLTTLIMSTVRDAQRQVAARVSEAFIPFGHPELTEQTKNLITYLPPEDTPDGAATADGPQDRFVPEELTEPQARPPAPAPHSPPLPTPSARAPRRRPAEDDTVDEMEPW
ncbi:DNA-binding protein YbaB [Saccharothrix ecbatanensis]|jgi:DNA-binding protein YbaB|uniref:DNA-binding protein YbaB n=1 Tax=Saccharothrix ecbatanensis TaxID=1105145 RepID=A0A7W9HJJ8_9PSEU|nr:YbaB/EbfC family nucleoid-associated protein [Saccharothrix ecbatanensis]MBB5803108.1 DNA-binding protein YbaB [Saccharothrix ecbatanensis]